MNKNCNYRDNNILYSHYVTHNPSQTSFYKHAHNEYELLYFIDGNAHYLVEDTIYELSPGDLIFIKPKSYHILLLDAAQPPYERVNIAFDNTVIEKDVLDMLFAENHKVALSLDSFFTEWSTRMDNCLKHYDAKDKQLAVKSLLTELLLSMKYFYPEPQLSAATTNPVLSKAIAYINAHIMSVKGLGDVAKYLFISESYLHYLFKTHLNISPKQYISEKKMLKAEELITAGIHPGEIYPQLGFEEYSSFFRAFKKHFGHAPSYHQSNATKLLPQKD